jgi:hypothetical protein
LGLRVPWKSGLEGSTYGGEGIEDLDGWKFDPFDIVRGREPSHREWLDYL